MPLLLKGGTSLLNAVQILRTLEIHEGHIVADLGCGGAGHFVGPTAAVVGKKGKVYAVDIQKNVLNTVKSRLEMQGFEHVELVRANLENVGSTPIPQESCDFSLIINVLFQNSKHADIIREAVRFLKKGGRLVVIDWSISAIPFGPPLQYRLKPSSVLDIAQTLGLEFVSEFEPGYAHFGLIFKK